MSSINSVMKTLIAVLITVVFVAGCAFPQKYDNNEYEQWVTMLVKVEHLGDVQCESATKAEIVATLDDLKFDARVAEVYAAATPNNEEVATAAAIVAEDFVEMRDFYSINDHNVTYCSRKAALTEAKIQAMVDVIPTKSRK